MIQYIEKHYQEKVTLNSLAEQMGYNPSYLSQLFRDNVGVNFYDYVTRKRLRESIFALQQTDKKYWTLLPTAVFRTSKRSTPNSKKYSGAHLPNTAAPLPRLPFHAGRKALTPMWNGKIPLWSKS